MGVRFRKWSLSRDYFWFVIAIAVTVITLSIWFSWLIYDSQRQEMARQLQFEGTRAERTLVGSLHYVTQLGTFLGTKIVSSGGNNYPYIASLFRERLTPDNITQNIFSWTFFDWINAGNSMCVSTHHGVLPASDWKDMSFRSYVQDARKTPWKLHFSDPSIGIPSGEWVIPAGLGVADQSGKFLGILSVGFNIGQLSQKIEESLTTKGIHFVFLTLDGKTVLHSSPSLLEQKRDYFAKVVKGMDFSQSLSGYLKKPLALGDVEYRYYRKLEQFPFILLMGYHDEVMGQYYKETLLPRITGFIAIGSISLLLLFILRQILVKPIVTLSQAADRVAHGDLDVVIPHYHVYEMANLAQQLENVVKYIKELQEVSSVLVKKSQAAQSASRAKSGFLACMSHELRTPLNAVIAFSEILKEEMFGPLGDQKYRDYARDIFNSGNHLLNIINNILDLSKAETGMLPLHLDGVDITETIRDCLGFVVTSAKKGKVSLHADLETGLPVLQMDRLRLKQILTNLLSNAVKFTLPGGSVTIKAFTARQDDDTADLCIIVSDTGIGMEAQDIPRAIEKFGQLDTGLNRKFEGTGLGLPLAAKLVELHQGKMEIESAIGKGTQVTLHFPNQVVAKEKQVEEVF